ncbi:MAG: hypothetical protein JNL11_03770 [Bdellovibrionaceae bacterium]|nr:hypothetical protein [Pseudobdellovibrionaceae bacterium]
MSLFKSHAVRAIVFTSTLFLSSITLAEQSACIGFYRSKYWVPPVHAQGEMTYAGPYRLSDESIRAYNVDQAPAGYGQVKITLPNGVSYIAKHQHYPLGEGKVGVRILPTSDQKTSVLRPSQTADGKDIFGGEIVDRYLENQYGLGQGDPLFAFMTFTTPQKSNNVAFANVSELVQHGVGHMGGYLGGSLSRHSPQQYVPPGSWKNARYPINLSTIEMKGVKSANLNQNIKISLEILNQFGNGVKFPTEPYTFDYYRFVNLEEVLAYWRGWNDHSWERFPGEGPYIKKLINDKTYHCYCSEHITMATNVAINVPHTLEAYTKIWGPQVGPDLFAKVKANFKTISAGQELPKIDNFVPVWERHGIKNPTAFNAFGKSLAWAPLTLADMVNGFLSFYVSFSKAGPLFSSLALLNFYTEVNKRIGLKQEDFMKMAFPAIVEMWRHDATLKLSQVPDIQTMNMALDQYIQNVAGGYTQVFATMGPTGAQLSQMIIPALSAQLKGSAQWILENKSATMEIAEAKYKEAVSDDLERARQVKAALTTEEGLVQGIKYVEHYSPPHIINLIVNGVVPTDQNITIKTVATAFPAAEVVQP